MNRRSFIEIKGGAYFAAALALLIVPSRWLLGVTLAAAIHECGHLLALRLCKVPVTAITIGASGAKIHTGYQTHAEQLICAAAGPLIGLLCAGVMGKMPIVSLCCYFQSLFNLLPVFPFDGGRVLRSLCCMIFGEVRGTTMFQILQVFLLSALVVFIFKLTIFRDMII